MHKLGKIALLITVILACEHKEFLNPYDPINFPPAPQPVFPGNNELCTTNPPPFEWTVDEDTLNPLYREAMNYELQISADYNFSSIVFSDSNISFNAIIPNIHFSEGNLYWRVRAKYTNGGWGDWSYAYQFQVLFPLLGFCDLDYAGNYDITQQQSYIYIAAQSAGLRIADISDPYAPGLCCSFYDSSISFNGLFVQNNYLYTISTSPSRFTIYDIQNPRNPIKLDSYDEPFAEFVDLWVSSNRAYVCCYWYYVKVFDVSNPDSIFSLGSLDFDAKEVVIQDNYAFFLKRNYSFCIFNILTNTTIATVDCGKYTYSLWVLNNNLFITTDDQILIYDTADPANPVLISTVDNLGININIYALDNRLFFTTYATGTPSMMIYDITDISNPLELGSIRHIDGRFCAKNGCIYTCTPSLSVFSYD